MKDNRFEELSYVLLNSEKPSEYFKELVIENRAGEMYPELFALIGIKQNSQFHKEGDVWTHTLLVLDAAAERRNKVSDPLFFMMSALCHDMGKAVATTEINGAVHSYKHEFEGISISKKFLVSLGADSEMIRYVTNMVENHMEPNMLARANSRIKKTNKLFYNSVSPYDLIQLSVCDCIGKLPYEGDNEKFLLDRLDIYNEIIKKPYVTEKDLLDAGIIKNENFDMILDHAHKLRLAGIDKSNALLQTISFARKMCK